MVSGYPAGAKMGDKNEEKILRISLNPVNLQSLQYVSQRSLPVVPCPVASFASLTTAAYLHPLHRTAIAARSHSGTAAHSRLPFPYAGPCKHNRAARATFCDSQGRARPLSTDIPGGFNDRLVPTLASHLSAAKVSHSGMAGGVGGATYCTCGCPLATLRLRWASEP